MSTTSLWPRPGTHAFRAWTRQLILTVLLPPIAVALAVASILVSTAPSATGGDGLFGMLWLALIAVALAGVWALFDRRTVLVGIFALAVALLINPVTVSIVLVTFGLS